MCASTCEYVCVDTVMVSAVMREREREREREMARGNVVCHVCCCKRNTEWDSDCSEVTLREVSMGRDSSRIRREDVRVNHAKGGVVAGNLRESAVEGLEISVPRRHGARLGLSHHLQRHLKCTYTVGYE